MEEIADGEPIERIEVSLAAILPHVSCPKCGGELTVEGKTPALLINISAKGSARAKERIAAVAEMGRIGMTTSRLDLEEVKARLVQTLGVIRDVLPAEQATALIKRLEPIWKAA